MNCTQDLLSKRTLKLGLSTGWSESVLASTRTWPAKARWKAKGLATDYWPPRVESVGLKGANSWFGRVRWWATAGGREVLSSPIWVEGAGSNEISPDLCRSEPNLIKKRRIWANLTKEESRSWLNLSESKQIPSDLSKGRPRVAGSELRNTRKSSDLGNFGIFF